MAVFVPLDERGIDTGLAEIVDKRGREDVAADASQHDGRGAVAAGGYRLVAALAAADQRDRLTHEGFVRGWQPRGGDDDVQVQGADDDDPAGQLRAP